MVREWRGLADGALRFGADIGQAGCRMPGLGHDQEGAAKANNHEHLRDPQISSVAVSAITLPKAPLPFKIGKMSSDNRMRSTLISLDIPRALGCMAPW